VAGVTFLEKTTAPAGKGPQGANAPGTFQQGKLRRKEGRGQEGSKTLLVKKRVGNDRRSSEAVKKKGGGNGKGERKPRIKSSEKTSDYTQKENGCGGGTKKP